MLRGDGGAEMRRGGVVVMTFSRDTGEISRLPDGDFLSDIDEYQRILGDIF
jgi:hypothetical protein